MVTRLTRVPAVPETVTSKEPAADELIAHAELSPALITEGVQTTVTPTGLAVASKVTAPWKPFWGCTLTLETALPPAMRERLQGEADREKSGCDPTKNSDMFRAPESFAFKGGRFQFASTVARCEKWL